MLFVFLFGCIFSFKGILKEGTIKGAHTKINKRYAHPLSYALVLEKKRKGSYTSFFLPEAL